MAANGTIAYVMEMPDCDFCKVAMDNAARKDEVANVRKAEYDFKTKQGPWGYGCRVHYLLYRMYKELGTGKGQSLKVAPDGAITKGAHN